MSFRQKARHKNLGGKWSRTNDLQISVWCSNHLSYPASSCCSCLYVGREGWIWTTVNKMLADFLSEHLLRSLYKTNIMEPLPLATWLPLDITYTIIPRFANHNQHYITPRHSVVGLRCHTSFHASHWIINANQGIITELFSPAPVHRSHPFSLLCPVPDNIYISFKPFLHNAFEKLVISAHPQRATASTLWWARLDSNQRSQKRLIYSQVELPLSDLPISVVKVRIGYEANLFGMLRSANKSPARVRVVKVFCNPFTGWSDNESYIKRTHNIIPFVFDYPIH